MNRNILLLLSVFMTHIVSVGQVQEIKGKVVDENHDPLFGATVKILNVDAGAITNKDGYFKIDALEGQTLIFSFVGMSEYRHTVQKEQAELLVILKEQDIWLNEVVSIGYGVMRKRDLAGAVASLKTEDIKAGIVTDAAQLIKGRVAGVSVRENSKEPGGGISVRIRGASSISSINDPLYVIDGFQTNMGNQINPDDIASIEVLKDASATAIYGARGANGVIIITTKKGVKGNYTVDYSSNVSTKKIAKTLDKLKVQDLINFRMKNWEDRGRPGNPPYTEEQRKYLGEGTDWLKLATQTALTQDHNITLSGGDNRLLMAVTGNYTQDDGVLKNTRFRRFSGRMNMSYHLTNRIRFGSYMYAVRTAKNYINMGKSAANDNVMFGIITAHPVETPYGVNVFGEPIKKVQVLSELTDIKFENVVNSLYGSLHGEADLTDWLKAKVQYTYNNENNKSMKYYPRVTSIGKANGGLAQVEMYKVDNQQLDALLTFHKDIAGKHVIKVVTGTTFSEYMEEGMGLSAKGFANDNFSYNNLGAAATQEGISSYKAKKTNLSFFARSEYVLNNKYIMNASVRADGASNFGEGNKWGFFPAVSLAWQLGDEKFMSFSKQILSNLKLRVSYGLSGNDGIRATESKTIFGSQYVYLGGENNVIGMPVKKPGNNKLKWESTAQFNAGTDFSLLKGRIEVNFDYYIKTTSDLLNPVAISVVGSGFPSILGNNGKIENRGFELFIRSNNISQSDFSWKTVLNLSRNSNKVLELNKGEARFERVRPHGSYDEQEYVMIKEGYPLSSIYGYVFDGIIQKDEDHSQQPLSVPGDPKFKDIDGDGVITINDRKVIGDGNPDIIIGLGNDLKYKNFDFSFFFDISLGAELLNLTQVYMQDYYLTKASLSAWSPTNPSNTIPRDNEKGGAYTNTSGMKYGSFVNSYFIESADFIRLSSVELGYTLPVQRMPWLKKHIKAFRFFVGAQNLFTYTPYTGLDPEVSTNGGLSYAQGLDLYAYPAFKSANAGVKIVF